MQDIAREEKVSDEMGNKIKVLEVNKDAPERTAVHQPAELMPQDNKRQMMATVAAPFGVLMVVCVGVALFDHRLRRIHCANEIAGGLGIRVVGAVPNLPHLERHLIDPAHDPDLEGHSVLESIDAIRTVLLRESQMEGTRVVMVSSAMPGEGKTTLAGHLAASLARAGRKTLLIDGDLRRPTLHELFELPMQPGFSEILLGEVESADAIQPTPQQDLSVIAAGQWDREVLHALARDGLMGILEKAREEFDFIIVDSHPVLPATDALLIGQHVDAVILAVLRQVSQMPRVYAATQRLTALGIRVLGAVVNGSDPQEVITGKAANNQAVAA
jgi:capsular exopolysaccharide synthesis family protein